MKKAAGFIVSRRYWIMGAALCLTVVCMLLSLRVGVNYDMTKYLPDQSAMKKGMDIMAAEFPSMGADKSIRVMAEGLDEARQAELLEKLKALPYVESVAHDGSEKYHKGDYSLFVIGTSYEYGSPEERTIESALAKDFQEYRTVYRNDNPGADGVSPWLLGGAIVILVAILAAMCESWFEPLLFLINIGIAIMMNEGTNLIMGKVSYVTSSMASVLQLVLSIDYSVMLMNRYRQEKARGLEKREAMAAALCNCVSPVTGSALTTAAGLLALAFMQFKIGLDLGIVLAKGVLISLLCVLTVLPGIVLLGDGLIEKTAKKTPRFSLGGLARFSYRRRIVLSVVFVLMFGAFYFLQGNTQIAYTLAKVDPIVDIFPPENLLVIVYENGDEEKMAALSDALEQRSDVTQVMGYPSIFGKAYGAAELADALDGLAGGMGVDTGAAGISFDPALLNTVYTLYFAGSSTPAEEQKLTIPQLFDYVHDKLLKNPLFSGMIPAETRETIAGAKEQLEDGMAMLKSDRYSRMIVYTYLPVESEATDALLDVIEKAGEGLTGEYYLIGNSAMSREMQGTFAQELRTITLLTAAAIFLIVLFTSRSFIIPALLVLIVQCGVYITVTAVGWQGYSIYFLALLIVECILMGATIDYGILYASYYRENRKTRSVPEALKAAYDGSVHAIMTSGLILVLVTGIIGATYSDPTVAEICRTISTGALSAILVILFLLPGLLATLDRLVVGRKKRDSDEQNRA
ncbi:MAG: MMPL family transporter [Clostridia bacterium]|nr:MMPL family transporter [Clostridia bacterium]